jgi:hypothetical protein
MRCSTCGKDKDEQEFNWRWKASGIRQKSCRDCQRKQRQTWYERHKQEHLENVHQRKQRVIQAAREFVWNYLLNHPCEICGEPDPRVLEFHHLHGNDKPISVMAGQGYSIESIQSEIKKCQVLCANCHRRVTYAEQGWFQKV